MITGIILKDNTLRLVLTGNDEMELAVLKALNGATCTLVTDNLRIGDRNITNALIVGINTSVEPEIDKS